MLVSNWHILVQDILPGLCSCRSAREIRLRVRDEDIAELVFSLLNTSPPVSSLASETSQDQKLRIGSG